MTYRLTRNMLYPIALLLLVSLFSCSDGLPKEFAAPEFSLKDLFDGTDIRLADLRGRPVVLYFFASW